MKAALLRVKGEELLNRVHALIAYLELPSRTEYWEALSTATRDAVQTGKSFFHLGYITMRPLVLLTWLVSQYLWIVARFFGKQLFAGFYVSMKKGFKQFTWVVKVALKWQSSLTREQVLVEIGVVCTLTVLFLLRRHIQKQKYVERGRSFYMRQRRKALKSYQRWVDQVSRTSLFLAMLLPHVLFSGVALSIKILFPRAVTWLANETYATFILSVAYPLVWNISLLYHYRHPQENQSKATTAPESIKKNTSEQSPNDKNESSSSTSKTRVAPFVRTSPTMTKAETDPNSGIVSKKTTSSRLFSSTAATRAKLRTRTNSKHTKQTKKATSVQRYVSATSSASSDDIIGQKGVYDVQKEANFWLQYWIVLALFNGVCQMSLYTPIVGRILSRSNWVVQSLAELELVFFIWIFGLPSVLTNTSSTATDFRRSFETRPLQLIVNRVKPLVIQAYEGTSGIIKEATWKMVTDKLKSFLQLAVLVRLMSEKRRDQILHAFEHSHAILIPAITLLMPGFTKYGVLYVKTIVTTASSCKKVNSSLDPVMDKLEYWVLHTVISGVLQWWRSLLSWLPFSGHLIFVLWCHIQTPKVSKSWYDTFEQELQAFGLLHGGGNKKVDDTVTASVIKRIVESLPSADDEVQVESTQETDHGGDRGSPPAGFNASSTKVVHDKDTVENKAVSAAVHTSTVPVSSSDTSGVDKTSSETRENECNNTNVESPAQAETVPEESQESPGPRRSARLRKQNKEA